MLELRRALPFRQLRLISFPFPRGRPDCVGKRPPHEILSFCSLSAAPPHPKTLSSDSTAIVNYEYVEGVERLYYYRSGGYHPINIGDKLHDSYRIVHKLGYGSYSTTWLARDELRKNLVAVKVGTSQASPREIDILSTLNESLKFSTDGSSGKSPILPLFDSFTVKGSNGIHPCYVTAPARCSLSDAKEASYNRLFQLDVARALAAQLVLAVAFTHGHGVVHGDLHLGNILLRLADDLRSLSDEQLYKLHGSPVLEPVRRLDGEPLPPGVPSHVVQPIWLGKPSEKFQLSEARVLLADFGEAFCPAREVNGESRAPLAIRPPEARFDTGRPLSFPSDIWMLACTIWAILGQRSLFDGLLATPDDMTREHVDALGMLPPVWWSKWDARRQWFTDAGGPTIERLVQSLEDRFEHSVQRARRNEGMPVIDPEEKDAIFAMLRSMLLFRPEARHTASQVLKSEWMEKWALPAYKKI